MAKRKGQRRAFPTGDSTNGGMSIREYAIIQVLASLSGTAFRPDKVVTLVDPQELVKTAVMLVDWMLEEFE